MKPITQKMLEALPVEKDLELRNGDLFFCSGQYLESKLIRFFTRSIWSHVGLVLDVSSEDKKYHLFLETHIGIGVRLVKRSFYTDLDDEGKLYDGPVVVARHQKADSSAISKALEFGLSQLGSHFCRNYVELVEMYLKRKFVKYLRHSRVTQWICSEFVAACLSAADLHYPSRDFALVTPSYIWEIPELELVGRVA